jgi:nucleotide-binding universal stress UspA family protein
VIPIHRILVPTDFSDPAHAALTWASTLAREFNSRIFLLHVVPEPYAYPWGTELATMNLTEILAQSEEGARQRLAELAEETGLPAARVIPSAVIGSPVDRILSIIKDEQIDLVVIGTHGRGLVGHLLLGSVAERVVRRSPVPVLTVHGDESAAARAQAAGASGVS